MTYHDLIQLYFERSNALQSYWTLYVVVIGGLLAFTSIRKEKDLRTTILVTVLFCFFADKNLDAIHDVTVQRLATLEAIKQFPEVPGPIDPARQLLLPTLKPPAFDGVRNFHVASDLLTIAACWAMELRRRRKPPDDKLPI